MTKRRYTTRRSMPDNFRYPTHRGHFVYIHRDHDGAPLYVGKTSDPKKRTNVHRSHFYRATGRSSWFGDVARIEWFTCESAEASHWLEGAVISAIKPANNLHRLDADAVRTLHAAPEQVAA